MLSTVLTGLRLSVSREMSLFLSPGCCCAGRSSVTDFIKKSTTQLMESSGQLCSYCPVEDNLFIRNQFSFTQNYHQYPSIFITILKKLTSYLPWDSMDNGACTVNCATFSNTCTCTLLTPSCNCRIINSNN